MELLRVISRELGYCHQCDRPCEVLVIELKGWKHFFNICDVCLKNLAEVFKEVKRYV